MRHIDLAPDLQNIRGTGQNLGNVGNGTGVLGHILAGIAIAARCGPHQDAILIAQRQRQAVNLRLGGVKQWRLRAQPQIFAHPVIEIGDIGQLECVFQAEHPNIVPHLGKAVSQRRTDLLGRAVRPFQFRKTRLNGRIAALQRIILGVGDLGRVFGVIGAVGIRNLQGQPIKLLPRLNRRQCIDGLHIGHPRLSLVLSKV